MNNLRTNNFGISGLRNYSINEMNLLLLISFSCKCTGTPIATLTFDELDQHAKIKDFSRFNSSYFEKLIQMTWIDETTSSIYCYPLINKIEVNLEKKKVNFFISLLLLNDIIEISDHFSSCDVDFFLALKSGYAKIAYILTKKMDGSKNYTISMQEFKKLLSIPIKYKMSDIDKKVFSQISDQLSLYYPSFQIEKINEKNRNAVGSLKFKFRRDVA